MTTGTDSISPQSSPEAGSPVALSDRYRLGRELGRGGMATVYLAEDLKHRRRVALKVLKPEIARAIGRDRFLREIEFAARLNHPHVLPLFDSGAAGELLYYVMPYIEGESLRDRLDREKQLPVEDALRLTREIASALGHAHQQGLVHRDIKPENILLADGIALLADFGIARAISAAAGDDEATQVATSAGTVLGTPRYMSPEQASGGEVDARTDIYALACVLFEMLAGQPPFVAPTLDGQLRMHLTVDPRPVSELRPSVPGSVSSVIARGLAKLPADRWPTAARFVEALAAAMTSGGTMTPSPAASATAPPNNLPRARTHFIGREKELTECARLLEDTRLLTLTGIGGCGKTRLALKLAENVFERFPEGVWFVDLAPLTDASRLAETVAAPLGIREQPGKDLTETLARHLQTKRLLLVLDNCEHLLSACAELANALLDSGRELRILTTSREGLGIEGERLFALRSLAVPAVEADRHAVEASEAVKLFVDRADLALSRFALTEGNAAAVAEICRRLDGIPLAIELAAARVKILSVDQIRARLDDRFRLLTGGSKTALPRHQTLRATIQWSYDQLQVEEQRLFRLLSVFAGGCTLVAATRVSSQNADEFEVMDVLTHLVDKSLVLVERAGAEPRYGLLETVRQYAQERLTEAQEGETVRQRHSSEFLALAERAYAERFTREEKWGLVLETEHDNLRAALDLVRGSDSERYLGLAGALAWFWQVRSHLVEGREHLTTALAASAPQPPRRARARALWGAANTLSWQGDAAAAMPMMEEALGIWRELGDVQEVALALEGIGWAQFLGGSDGAACATFEECLRLQREGGDPVLVNRAMVALAQVLVALHRVEEARPMASEIIAFSKTHDDRRNEHFGWHYLADCALIEGKCDQSLPLYRDSLVLAQAIGDRLEMSFEVQGVAMSLAGLGESDRAFRLAASAKAEWERIGVDLHMRFWDELMERYIGGARRASGEEAADRSWKEGRHLPFDQAIEIALGAGKNA